MQQRRLSQLYIKIYFIKLNYNKLHVLFQFFAKNHHFYLILYLCQILQQISFQFLKLIFKDMKTLNSEFIS